MNKIKVALVSFYLNEYNGFIQKDEEKDYNNFFKIITETECNLFIFSGWTINQIRFEDLKSKIIKNKSSLKNKLVIFEIYEAIENKKGKDIVDKTSANRIIYIIRNGELICTNVQQIFHDSYSATRHNVEMLLNETKTGNDSSRIVKFDERKILILVCGELFLLVNRLNTGEAEIRHASLRLRFEALFNDVDIIANIVHTPFGNRSNKYSYKRFFGSSGRTYLSTANRTKLQRDSLQYAFKDGEIQRLTPVNPETEYFLQTYDIE